MHSGSPQEEIQQEGFACAEGTGYGDDRDLHPRRNLRADATRLAAVLGLYTRTTDTATAAAQNLARTPHLAEYFGELCLVELELVAGLIDLDDLRHQQKVPVRTRDFESV